jgi:hypothetical protein
VQNTVVEERQRCVVWPEKSEHVAGVPAIDITLCKRGSCVSQNQFEVYDPAEKELLYPRISLRYITR